MSKKRLDVLVVELGLCENRTKAQALIFEGAVDVDGIRVTKAGAQVKEGSAVTLRDIGKKYVGRGGLKLAHALDTFKINPAGFIVADAGASTGGFTDCVLQRGAVKVYAIDVGYGQLDYRLRQDPRVINMERVNIRVLATLPEPVDLVVMDVSFISSRLLLPVVREWLRRSSLDQGGTKNVDLVADRQIPLNPPFIKGGISSRAAGIVLLFKPQFEVGKLIANRFKGVIADEQVRLDALANFRVWLAEHDFTILGECESPIQGDKGNHEYLLHLI